MKTVYWLWLLALSVPLTLVLAGCKDAAPDQTKVSATDKGKVSDKSADKQGDEGEILASLAQLSPEDQKLAEEQRFCVVMNDSRLGSMGKPFKLMVREQPVFLCCKGCQRKALANPNQTLAKVKQLRAKNTGATAK